MEDEYCPNYIGIFMVSAADMGSLKLYCSDLKILCDSRALETKGEKAMFRHTLACDCCTSLLNYVVLPLKRPP